MTLFLAIIAAPVALAMAMFALELLFGLKRSQNLADISNSGRTVIVIPAHDEAGVIGPTVERLLADLTPAFEILVVADNCRDDSAGEARRAGAQVIERHDAGKKGKGFALAFARDHLTIEAPDAVIVLDADCSVGGASLRKLSAAATIGKRPAQAINLLRPAVDGSPMTALSSFAFLIKNLVRQRGLQRLAGTVHLTGTGMAFPWAIFRDAPLATASIVEDMKLGLDLAMEGKPSALVANAVVWSDHASRDDTLKQRSRWEGGYLATSAALVPGLLRDAVTKRSMRRLLMALDLSIPPLALLFVVDVAVLCALLVIVAVTQRGWFVLAGLGTISLLAGALLLLAWWREGRDFIRAKQLVMIPLYALWKLPMYLGLLRNGIPGWVRTRG